MPYNETHDTFRELRGQIDGSDPFMTGGHQVIRPRTAFKKHKKPAWVNNDKTVRELLLKCFPKLQRDATQRFRAARWLRIIQLYYRAGMTKKEVAEEMHEKRTGIHQILQRIRLASKGLTDKGKARGLRPRGRPQKGRTLSNIYGRVKSP